MTSAVQHWLAALRPRTLGVGVAPVLLGVAIAADADILDVTAALLALVGALLLQIVSNLANDYYDFKNGADTDERIGPTRATQAGLISPTAMRNAFVLVLLAVVPVATFLASAGGWPIVAIGLTGAAAAVLYTGGPLPLGYIGLGDILVLVFFGPAAVYGTVLVQAGARGVDLSSSLAGAAALAGLLPGLLAANVLVVNNLRDRFTDAKANKRTLAVRFGALGARLEYGACVVGAFGAVVTLVALGWAPASTLVTFLAAPVWGLLLVKVARLDGAALNPYLGKTAGALVVTTILFSLGWWFG